MKEQTTKRLLLQRMLSLTSELYQRCGADIDSFESLCRRIHIVRQKLESFKGGIYDKSNQ